MPQLSLSPKGDAPAVLLARTSIGEILQVPCPSIEDNDLPEVLSPEQQAAVLVRFFDNAFPDEGPSREQAINSMIAADREAGLRPQGFTEVSLSSLTFANVTMVWSLGSPISEKVKYCLGHLRALCEGKTIVCDNRFSHRKLGQKVADLQHCGVRLSTQRFLTGPYFTQCSACAHAKATLCSNKAMVSLPIELLHLVGVLEAMQAEGTLTAKKREEAARLFSNLVESLRTRNLSNEELTSAASLACKLTGRTKWQPPFDVVGNSGLSGLKQLIENSGFSLQPVAV